MITYLIKVTAEGGILACPYRREAEKRDIEKLLEGQAEEIKTKLFSDVFLAFNPFDKKGGINEFARSAAEGKLQEPIRGDAVLFIKKRDLYKGFSPETAQGIINLIRRDISAE